MTSACSRGLHLARPPYDLSTALSRGDHPHAPGAGNPPPLPALARRSPHRHPKSHPPRFPLQFYSDTACTKQFDDISLSGGCYNITSVLEIVSKVAPYAGLSVDCSDTQNINATLYWSLEEGCECG